jgi:hypothetical protein
MWAALILAALTAGVTVGKASYACSTGFLLLPAGSIKLVFVTFVVQAHAQIWVDYPSSDFNGADLNPGGTGGQTLDSCKALCVANPSCCFISWAVPGVDLYSPGLCFIKSAIGWTYVADVPNRFSAALYSRLSASDQARLPSVSRSPSPSSTASRTRTASCSRTPSTSRSRSQTATRSSSRSPTATATSGSPTPSWTMSPTPTLVPCYAGFYCMDGSPKQCPGGYFCPLGTWDPRQSPAGTCGRGNYCPAGSSSPLPCPLVVGPNGPANGPAFLVETAACYNHCFNGGPGQLSEC